jgi:UDP-glucuronate 4-epimerase
MAYAYAHQFGLPATGLRFFTVYGPSGRPDMAVWLFTEAILQGQPLKLFNSGHMDRDFTYVDDVIESVERLIKMVPEKSPDQQQPPHRVYNIGNSQPVEVVELVDILEKIIGKPARRELLPMRPVDVLETFADSSDLKRLTGFAPCTPIEQGLRAFVDWYRQYDQRCS